MRRLSLFCLLILLIFPHLVSSEELSNQSQGELIDLARYVHNEISILQSIESADLPHCGTQIAFNLFINRDNFSKEYAQIVTRLRSRPVLQTWLNSPSGHFRIHYDTSGSNVVFQTLVDTIPLGGDGVPDYVNKVCQIVDSVWSFTVDHLGFPTPVSDGTNGGGNDLVDIYIANIAPYIYGWTEPESQVSDQSVTSFVVIDNDYNDIPPYNSSTLMNRRLDAARVTLAHEFFHVIHFSMDFTEYEDQGAIQAMPWWEMSSTWMEEMMYDEINDYYFYLKYYYDEPWKSLQAVTSYVDLHQYGAAVFPIYLTEKFDTSVVRDIWERCRDYGVGPQFTIAANDAIDSITGGSYNLLSAYQEFAVWNVFTGTRAAGAPDGFIFSEAEEYAMIPDSFLICLEDYGKFQLLWDDIEGWPDTTDNGDTIILCGTALTFYESHTPQNLGANYLNMQNLQCINDSILDFYFYGEPDYDYGALWGLSVVKFPVIETHPPVVDLYDIEFSDIKTIEIPVDLYRSVVAIPTPVSTDYRAYYYKREGYGYSVQFSDTSINIAGCVNYYDMIRKIPNVVLFLTDNDSTMLIPCPDGDYDISGIPEGNYVLTAEKYEDDNGVSVADIVKIRRYLAQLDSFDTPFKIIASDVTLNDTVSVADIIKIRRYIVGLEALPSGNWRFIDSAFPITPSNWYEASDSIEVAFSGECLMGLNFIGVRLGDVNNTWDQYKSIKSNNSSAKLLAIKETYGLSGKNIAVPLLIEENIELAGIELHLKYDIESLSFLNVTSELSGEITVNANENDIHIIWEDIDNVVITEHNRPVIYLNFRIKEGLKNETEIGFVDAEIVNVQGRPYNIETVNGKIRRGNQQSESTMSPEKYSLKQNRPNPFNPITKIEFSLPEAVDVKLVIYNIMGQRIETLINNRLEAGIHSYRWDASEYPSGIYFTRLRAGSFTDAKKMILLK